MNPNTVNDKMDKWDHDRPAFVDEEEKSLKHLLKTCKSVEELTEKLGYDSDRFEIDLGQTVQEKNLKSHIIVVRDKMAHNKPMLKQYKEFLKKKSKLLPEVQKKMKFEFRPEKHEKGGRKRIKKVKFPKCFAKGFGQYKCKACEWVNLCEKSGKDGKEEK